MYDFTGAPGYALVVVAQNSLIGAKIAYMGLSLLIARSLVRRRLYKTAPIQRLHIDGVTPY